MNELKRILLPTDFSENSEIALKYARAMADAFGASLHVLHVIEDPYVYGWTGFGHVPDIPSYRQSLQKNVTERLLSVFNPADRERYKAELAAEFGHPFVEIIRYAKRQDIDLIVMGTHGRGPVGHLLMGSVADKVVRKAPCPVLTVRHPKHEFVMP